MSERAHPDDVGFKNKFEIRFWRKIFPYPVYKINPYRQAFYWRYKWANQFCDRKIVLDVPCGMGWGTSLLSNALQRFGADISIEAVTEARYRYKNCKFLVCDMQSLPFSERIFEIVCCLEGIEHVSQKKAEFFVSEVNRLLVPNGEFLLSSPAKLGGGHSGNPYHIKEYCNQEIEDMVSHFFIVIERIDKIVDNLIVSYYRLKKRG